MQTPDGVGVAATRRLKEVLDTRWCMIWCDVMWYDVTLYSRRCMKLTEMEMIFKELERGVLDVGPARSKTWCRGRDDLTTGTAAVVPKSNTTF